MTILSNRPSTTDTATTTVTRTVTIPVRTLAALVAIAGLLVLLAGWTGFRTGGSPARVAKVYTERVYAMHDGASANPAPGHRALYIAPGTMWFGSGGDAHLDDGTAPCLQARAWSGAHWAHIRYGVADFTGPDSMVGTAVVWVQCLPG